MISPRALGQRGTRRRLDGDRPKPGGRELALRLLWGLLVLEFVLVFPILMQPDGLGPLAWERFAAAETGAAAAVALLIGALSAAEPDGRLAYALAVL